MKLRNPYAPATPNQRNAITRMAGTRQISEEAKAALLEVAQSPTLTMGKASDYIDRLDKKPVLPPTGDLATVVQHLRRKHAEGKLSDFDKSLLQQFQQRGSLSDRQIAAVMRKIPGGAVQQPDVPAGRYALQMGGDGDWMLFRVWRKGDSPIQVYGVKGVEDGERLGNLAEQHVLVLIAKDPAKAAIEFGRRTGHCYRCGLELDVNLSRAMAVGPTCVKHVMGDGATAYTRKHRDRLRAAGIDPAGKFDSLEALEVAA
jgi:hypothetical protein